MIQIRKELMEKKNQRKRFDKRPWATDSVQDLEIKKMRRREFSRRMEGVKASGVDNKFVQNKAEKLQNY